MTPKQEALQRLLDEAIDKMDWRVLANVYAMLEWRWHGDGYSPTADALRARAADLAKAVIECAADDAHSWGASGGGLSVGYESDSDGKLNAYVSFSKDALAYEDLIDCINRGGYRDNEAERP